MRDEIFNANQLERKRWLETRLAKKCSGANIDSFSIEGLNPVHDPLTIKYEFYTSTFAQLSQEVMLFNPGLISKLDLPDYFRSVSRSNPVRLQFSQKKEMHLSVQLPPSWKLSTPLLTDSLSSEFGKAIWKWQNEEQIFDVKTTYYLEKNDILPNQYSDFRNFLDSIREKDLKVAVFKKTDP